ncbi:MAG: metallophosphoesterase family protein, partial [Clostridia bacterium]|nr:metallophosphoesterase family protein [Clostridia bacterium]
MKAKSEKADICLFGHTHRQFYESRDGFVILNPGSAGKYALIT